MAELLVVIEPKMLFVEYVSADMINKVLNIICSVLLHFQKLRHRALFCC